MERSLEEILFNSLKYMHFQERLATFKSWEFDDDAPCNINKMAEAGFIWIGNKNEPDSVKCFFCNKTLDGWESDDNPWTEHIQHAGHCTFANLQKTEDDMTLITFWKLKQELMKQIINSYFKDKIDVFAKTKKGATAAFKK